MFRIFDIFLENAYLPIYAITVIVALWRFPRYYDTVFKYLPVLLTYTFLNEVLGNIIKYFDEYDFVFKDLLTYNNWVIYNIYDIIFYVYFIYVYWLSTKKEYARKIILTGGILYLIAAVVNPFLTDFLTRFQMISYFTGASVLIASIFIYLNYHKQKTGSVFNSRNLLSWISAGILVFLMGYIPLIILGHLEIVPRADFQIIRRIHLLLILTMYSCFILGFIRMSKKQIV